jgi:hypothetical protein
MALTFSDVNPNQTYRTQHSPRGSRHHRDNARFIPEKRWMMPGLTTAVFAQAETHATSIFSFAKATRAKLLVLFPILCSKGHVFCA